MISKTFNRYIWLLNTLLQQKKLTFEEISNRWEYSCLSDGKPLALRTFHVHREAIAELFGVEIKCDTSTYKYYVSSPDTLQNDRTRQWLLNSFTLSNMIQAGRNMKERILFEDIPKGTEYIQTVIESMQQNKELKISYKPFNCNSATLHIQPYAMKVYHQRWYIVGYLKEQKAIRNISLDRTLSMEITTEMFQYPKDFNAEEYYYNTVGIFINEKLKPQKIVIRAYGIHVEYMRTLPLHHTQEEVQCKNQKYSDFQYYLCVTPELINQLLSMGEKIEVLEPVELRKEIKTRLLNSLNHYNYE